MRGDEFRLGSEMAANADREGIEQIRLNRLTAAESSDSVDVV